MRSVVGDPRDALGDLGVGHAAKLRLQREFEVLAHRVARVERILLQHQRHVALGSAPVGDVDAVDEDLAGGRLLQSGDQAQRRRLAGAGLAEQHEELAVGDVEVEVLQRGVAAEVLGDVLELDVGHDLASLGDETSAKIAAVTPSELPLAVSKKCAWAGIDPGEDSVAGRLDVAALGAGAQHLRADLQVDDVVGAERLDDVRLDRQVAVGGVAADQHAFRADAERQIAVGALCRRACRAALAGKAKPCSARPRP